MTNLKKITLGLALAATSLAVSVAQAQGQGNGRRGDRLDRGRGGHVGVGVQRGARRVVRLADQMLFDLNTLSRIVRNRSMSQGTRGPARRALQDLQYVKQDIRQLKRVAMRRGIVPRLRMLHQQARQDGRIAVQTINRVRFVTRRAEYRAANQIDLIRSSMQRINQILNNNLGRGGRG